MALSLRLLGAETFAARLPFALLGVLTIVSLYALGVSLFGDRALALGAAALLTLSVPFLLYVRQARYYAVAALAAVWVLYFFFALLRDRRCAVLGLALAHINPPNPAVEAVRSDLFSAGEETLGRNRTGVPR